MPTFTIEAQWLNQESKVWSGEFAVAGGAVTAGSVKFHNAVTVTRNSAGLFTFAMFADNPKLIAFKPLRLAMVHPTFITPPGGAAEGGWAWTLNADNVASAGTFQLRINQQSWAAADPVQTVKMVWITEGRAAA